MIRIVMGSAALMVAVPYSGKVTQIPCKEQWSTENNNNKKL